MSDCRDSEPTLDNGHENSTADIELLRVLADPRRKSIIEHFLDASDSDADLSTLAASLSSIDESIAYSSDTPTREQIATELHHIHLPKLADLGVLEYDPEQREVSYYDDPEIENVLAVLCSYE